MWIESENGFQLSQNIDALWLATESTIAKEGLRDKIKRVNKDATELEYMYINGWPTSRWRRVQREDQTT